MIGTKLITRKINVMFDDNISYSGSYYYESGASIKKISNSSTDGVDFTGTTSSFYDIYDTISSIKTTAVCYYTLDGMTYTLKTDGWYLDRACTVSALNALVKPNDTHKNNYEMKLYAKWITSAVASRTVSSGGTYYIKLPKFIKYISGTIIGGGASSGYCETQVEEDGSEAASVGFWSSGKDGATKTLATSTVKNNSTVTLTVGAASSGKGNSSSLTYKNTSGTDVTTTASGGSSTGSSPGDHEFNIMCADSDNAPYTGSSSISVAKYLTSNTSGNYLTKKYTIGNAETWFVRLEANLVAYSTLDDDDNGQYWPNWFRNNGFGSISNNMTTNRRGSNKQKTLYPIAFRLKNTTSGDVCTYGIGGGREYTY